MKSLGLCHKTCKTCMSSMASIIRIRAVQLVLEASLRETCTEGHNFLMPKEGAVPTSNGFRCVEVFRCTRCFQRKSSFFWWHGVMCSKLTHLKWAYNFPWHDFQRNLTLWKGSTRWKVLGHGGMADESSKGMRILWFHPGKGYTNPKNAISSISASASSESFLDSLENLETAGTTFTCTASPNRQRDSWPNCHPSLKPYP